MRARRVAKFSRDTDPLVLIPPVHLPRILDEVRDVAIVVSKDRRLRYCNRAAAEYLAREDPLRLVADRLLCSSDTADILLGRAIDVACAQDGSEPTTLVLSDRDNVPAVVAVRCLDLPDREFVLVLCADPRPDLSRVIEPLKQCFRLTQAEAMVAAGVAEGSSLSEIASRRKVTVGTIRTQLKTVAAKLGCARQSQIAAIVHATPWFAWER